MLYGHLPSFKYPVHSDSDKISVSCLHGEGFVSQRCVCELTGLKKQENGGNLDLVHGCRTEILQKFDEYIDRTNNRNSCRFFVAFFWKFPLL